MNTNLSSSTNEQLPNPQLPLETSSQTREKKRWVRITLLISIALVLCCCGALAWGAQNSAATTRSQKQPVQVVIDQFMQAMENKDAEAAYTVFAQDARNDVKLSDLEKWLTGSGYATFDAYESTTISDLSISAPIFAWGSLDRTTASATGYLTYSGGKTTPVQATLLMEDGEWKLVYIFISITPQDDK